MPYWFGKEDMKLYPYQETCVNFHLLHEYSINGCAMGLGKSFIALEFIKRTGKPGLVIGPAFLKGTWLGEANKFGVPIHFVPYSQIHKFSVKDLRQFGTWIADEITYIKNPKSLRTNAVYTLLKAVKPPYFLGLSGTIIKNKIFDLWVPLAICSQSPNNTNGLHLEGDLQKYRAFSYHFCHVEIMKIRGARVEKFGGVKEEKIPELKALLKDKYISYKVEDVLKDLPTMTRKEVMLDLRPVAGLEEAFKNYMAGSKVDPTAKALSALLKAPSTAEYVEVMLEAGESVLVFTDHIKSAEEIAAKIKVGEFVKGAVCITGKMPSEERHKYVEAFQVGDLKCIVATIGALSTGVTLTAARHVVFNDLNWSHSENQQAAARVSRIGQVRPTFAHYILGSDTDAHIAKTLITKEQTVLKVLGD
jgi:SWI/SNF-related matrix-associated actin-dependent regulator 1 of chromatin subfamily A